MAVGECPHGYKLMVKGNFNANLAGPEVSNWDKEITAAVATSGLENLVGNLFPQQREWCRIQRMWASMSQGRVVRTKTEYILGSNRWKFQNVAV